MKCRKPVYIAGDQNSRFGSLIFGNRIYENNADNVKNTQGGLLADIYNKFGFYPINHLQTKNKRYHGDYTFFRGDKKSQVDFLFTNDHVNVTEFHLAEEGLVVSDHKMIEFKVNMK